MKIYMMLMIVLASVLNLSGCSYIRVTDVKSPSDPHEGIRVYEPRVYLLVDVSEKETTIVYAPNYTRGYDIKPVSILSKHDFNVEIGEGLLQKVSSNQDSTALLTFIQGAAELGAKAVGSGVSSKILKGTFGLQNGIYWLKDDGTFEKI